MPQDERMIAALLRERRTYVSQDKPDRIEQVDAELSRHGYRPEPEVATDTPPQDRTAGDPAQQTADTPAPAKKAAAPRISKPKD